MSANAEKKPAAKNRAKGRKRMSQAERTAASDRRMRDAAIELICSKGAHNTTLKEIGELAGFMLGHRGVEEGGRVGHGGSVQKLRGRARP